MAKYRAPRTVVPVAIAFPMADTIIKPIMCKERSFVFEDVHVTTMETRKVANYRGDSMVSMVFSNKGPLRQDGLTQTGAVSHRVVILS
jgi:hypothetical protein